ncbi:serine/threonine-protein kinase [Streptomyces sp. NPDC050560]|uniref:serine/threonine-protein kinase n=1 Tax=Streptomyces sp. NPDC050560 TaxID=3365630 RepID=UPI0037A7C374
MTNHGGEPSEPTSYELRPPQVPPQAAHGAPGPSGYGPAESAQPAAPGSQGQGAPEGGRHVPPPPAAPAGGYGPPSHAPAPTQVASPSGTGAGDGTGRVVGDRYELLARLGHGGMGTVWRAKDRVVQREVAVKEPRLPEHLSEAERQTAYQRMEREARAAARIDHPSVVTVHDVVVEGGRPWVVMELVRGQSLADRLQEGTLDPREAAGIGLAVLGALQAAHEAGVLHRDVKPDNVLLGRSDRVVLTDFGIAQVEGEAQLTETGAFVGSPEFIAPERVLGQRPGSASDLWSLGVVLYAAVEGMSPFRRSHTPATLQAVLSAEPASPSRAEGPLAMVIMQLLRKDPLARPGVAEVRDGLKAVAAPTVPRTAVLPQPPRSSRWLPPALKESRRARYGTGAGVLVVVIALVLLLTDPFSSEPTLPHGWETHPENEAVSASLGMPSDYHRSADEDSGIVTFTDPSGVFTVYLSQTDNAELTDDDNPVAPTGAAWEKYYNDGGDMGTDFNDVTAKSHKVTHQGHTAWDITADYVSGSDTSDDNPIRHRDHLLVIPKDPTGKKSKVYWKLEVDMPAKGWANKDGEELFEHAVDNLEIQGF